MKDLTLQQINTGIATKLYEPSVMTERLMTLTVKEVKRLVSVGEITHGQALAVMEKLELKEYNDAKRADLLSITTANVYVDVEAICQSDSKWQERHLKPMIEDILVVERNLTSEELDDIAALFPEEDGLSRNSFDFINKAIVTILFPKNSMTPVNLTYKWIPAFVLAYAKELSYQMV